MAESESSNSFERLSTILDILRRECPWDRVQTIESLRYLTIEEVSELSEAIIDRQPDEIRKELGDLFMHLLFYVKIAQDRKLFTLDDVLHGISDKLVSRHPHIVLPDRNGIMQGGSQNPVPQWEKVKMKEGRKSVLEGVPRTLPTLVKSVRMQEKAAGIGFDYDTADDAFVKVKEEYDELKEAIDSAACPTEQGPEKAKRAMEEEFGDLLFALIKWGDKMGINADDALAHTNQKFLYRFQHMETAAQAQGRTVGDLSKKEMLELWNSAKDA